MSHVAEVKMRIMDLDALAQAAAACGLEFKQDQTEYRWYGRFVGDYNAADAAANTRDPRLFGKCDHAVVVPGDSKAYGVGVVPATDGYGYDLVYDNWQGGYGLEEKAGRGLSKLKQEYAAAAAERQLARQGYETQRTTNARGELQVLGYRR